MEEAGQKKTVLLASKKFRETLYNNSLSSKNKISRVVHACFLGRAEIFLHGLEGTESDSSQWTSPAFSSAGLVCFEPGAVSAAKGLTKKDEYILLYELESKTLQLSWGEEHFVLEEREWINTAAILYTNMADIDGRRPTKAMLSHVNVVGLGTFPASLRDGLFDISVSKEQLTAFIDLVKMNSRKDGLGVLAELPVVYLRLLFVSPPSTTQSQVLFSKESPQPFLEFFQLVSTDDLLSSPAALGKFASHFFSQSLLSQASIIANYESQRELLSFKRVERLRQLPSAHFFRAALNYQLHPEKLRNVHLALMHSVPGRKTVVRPSYIYFHYKQDGMNDDGWGCAYRSLQTLASHIALNTNSAGFVPNLREIQEILVKIKDKPSSFIGSREWIGSFEVSFVLKHIFDIDSNILHAATGSQIPDLAPALRNHFQVFGTPVMIGGGCLAYTLLGISEDEDQNVQFLILDPHYKGPDDLKTVLSPKSKAVYWTNGRIFSSTSFYNLCCPNI